MSDGSSAKAIAQRLLDRTGRGLMSGDFELFSSCFILPQEIETFDGRRQLSCIADVRSIFDAVRAHHQKMGVTDLVRNCVNAEFRDPATISTIHQSRLLSGSILVQKPYNVFSVIVLRNNVWQSAQSQYAIDDSPSLCQALVGSQPEAAA